MSFKIRRTMAGIKIGAGTTDKIGFHGVTPSAQRAGANQAAANDAATTQTLVNEIRLALIEKGIIKGSA